MDGSTSQSRSAARITFFRNEGGPPGGIVFTQLPGTGVTTFFAPAGPGDPPVIFAGSRPYYADMNGDGLVDRDPGGIGRPALLGGPPLGCPSEFRSRLLLASAGRSANTDRRIPSRPRPLTEHTGSSVFTRLGNSGGLFSIVENAALESQFDFQATGLNLESLAAQFGYWLVDVNGDGLEDVIMSSGAAADTAADPKSFVSTGRPQLHRAVSTDVKLEDQRQVERPRI
jgi:hypothetical protein